MATIANLAVQLSANPAGFVAGLDSAAARTKMFADMVAKTTANTGAAAAKAAASAAAGAAEAIPGAEILAVIDKVIGVVKALGDIGGTAIRGVTSALVGMSQTAGAVADKLMSGDLFGAARVGVTSVLGVVESLADKVPLIGGLLSASVGLVSAAFAEAMNWGERLLTWFKQGEASINQMRSASIQLGISFQEAGALALAAGGDVERITRMMLHLNSTIQSARTGDAGALALLSGRLKLSAEALAQMGGTQRLEAVMGALDGVTDSLTRASTESGILGERAEMAFGVMMKSGKGLEAFRQANKRFGLDLGAANPDEAMAMANLGKDATRTLAQVDMAITGIKMNVAAGLAPIIVKLGELFGNVGVDAKGVQNAVVDGSKWMAHAGADVIVAWRGMEGVWLTLKMGWKSLLSEMMDGLAQLFDQFAKLPGAMGGDHFTEYAKLAREGARSAKLDIGFLALEMDKLRARADPHALVGQFFAGVDAMRKKAEDAAANAAKPGYAPIVAPVQLAGAAQYGTQEAYKTLGQFAAGESASLASKQLTSSQKIEALIQKGDLSLDEIRRQLKRGMVREGKFKMRRRVVRGGHREGGEPCPRPLFRLQGRGY